MLLSSLRSCSRFSVSTSWFSRRDRRTPEAESHGQPDPQDQSRRNQAGFTLLELLVVITILGLLAAVAGTAAINYLGRARTDTTKLQIDQISAGLDLFRLDNARYPTKEEGLDALFEAPDGLARWQGPYLKKREAITDAWGIPFRYENPGRHGEVDIYSYGADNAEGGDGENSDVTSW